MAPLRLGATESPVLNIDEFLAEALPLAEELLRNPSQMAQDNYLLSVAALAVFLGDVPEPPLKESPAFGPGTFIGSNAAKPPIVVLHWKMQPGSEIRRHAHAYGNVVTLGLAGSAQVENFEVIGERDYDSTSPFRVRRTVQQELTAGTLNLVNLERNYIHGFRAGPEGARGLDITTRVLDKRPTPWLDLRRQSTDDPDVFEAVWEI
jgi:quercetin dioxygenase-like cupin family protein